ncbi:hypothetical protein TCAL_15851, partial [Tigriopus californicus]
MNATNRVVGDPVIAELVALLGNQIIILHYESQNPTKIGDSLLGGVSIVKRLKECHEKYSKTYDLHFANELSAAYIPPANAYNLMDFGKAMASTTTAMKTFLQALPRDQNTKQTSSGTY